jgi:hypothetical protein
VDAGQDGASPGLVEAGAFCGDGVCNGAENCHTCANDCGACPKCELAPSCDGAHGVPANPLPRGDLSQPPAKPGDGGTATIDAGGGYGTGNCTDPQIRMRIESLKAYSGGGVLYCIIDASDGVTSELALTPKTSNLGDSDENFFPLGQATFWGQKDLHTTTNNLLVTYNCYRVKNDAWSNALKAAGDTAAQLGGTSVSPYGWAFGIAGVAANAAAAAIATSSANDTLVLNAQQVIAKESLLDLTNGRTWTIRKSDSGGVFGIGGWDWQLLLEAWGCADAIPTAK